MRTYWLKIALGALGVFVVGLIVHSVIGHGVDRVESIKNTSEPISIPLAFIPFKVNGERYGTINRVVLRRSAPDQVIGADIRVKLADSITLDRWAQCLLVVEDVERINERTTFRCQTAADTAGRDLVAFGEIFLPNDGPRLAYLIPRAEAEQFRSGNVNADSLSAFSDSVTEAEIDRADSVADADMERADSITELHIERADSIREAALERADSIRQRAHRWRDSLRERLRRRATE